MCSKWFSLLASFACHLISLFFSNVLEAVGVAPVESSLKYVSVISSSLVSSFIIVEDLPTNLFSSNLFPVVVDNVASENT